jgi:hypothetical protein
MVFGFRDKKSSVDVLESLVHIQETVDHIHTCVLGPLVVVHTTDKEVLLVKIEVWTIQVKVQIIEGETPEREEDRREV